MAGYLTGQVRPEQPFTETGVRKLLQRARAQFAEALLDDVAHSLGHPAPDALEQELIDLDLLPYCRDALSRKEQGLEPGAQSYPLENESTACRRRSEPPLDLHLKLAIETAVGAG